MSIQATIALEVDEEVLIKRLLNRERIAVVQMIKMRKRFAIGLKSTIIKRSATTKHKQILLYYRSRNRDEISEQLIALLDSL